MNRAFCQVRVNAHQVSMRLGGDWHVMIEHVTRRPVHDCIVCTSPSAQTAWGFVHLKEARE